MAEIAISAMIAFGSTTAGAMATVATAGAGFGMIASTGLTLLSAAASVGSVMTQLQAGQAQERQLTMQVGWDEIGAKQQILDSQTKAETIRTEYLRRNGQAMVAFAASGLDVSSGGAIFDNLKSEADHGVSATLRSGKMASLGYESDAAQHKAQAAGAVSGAQAQAFGTGVNTLISIAKRG
jgi:hypothetical protein